jgi:hypothetical protein
MFAEVSCRDALAEQHVDLAKGESLGLGDSEESPDKTQGSGTSPEEARFSAADVSS